jgi:ElaB/YqjD/DUF883 family membrane-anchored ribosome-binding protein
MRGESGGCVDAWGRPAPGPNSESREIQDEVKAMNAEQVRQDTEDGLDATVDQFESARERVQHAFEQGKEQWMQIQDQAVQYSKEVADSTDKFVREKPWQAVGIAAAIGLVAGLLIRRR